MNLAMAERTFPLPPFATNSSRAIINAFDESIIQLKSSGNIAGTNETHVEELHEYGDSMITYTNTGHAYQHLGKANR